MALSRFATWFVLLALTLTPGCGDPLGWDIPDARTSAPPEAFSELASHAWYATWGASQAAFNRKVTQYAAEGYRLADLEIYRYDGQTQFAGIWLKDHRAWKAWWQHDRHAFDQQFKVMSAKGYQPVDLEITSFDGDARYSAIWIENPVGPRWVMRWGLDYEQFKDELDARAAEGYQPVDLEMVEVNGHARYAYIMVFAPDVDWVIRWGLSRDRMGEELDALVLEGYRIIDLDVFFPGGEVRGGAILVRDDWPVDWDFTMSRSSGELDEVFEGMGGYYRPASIFVAPHEDGGMLYVWTWLAN